MFLFPLWPGPAGAYSVSVSTFSPGINWYSIFRSRRLAIRIAGMLSFLRIPAYILLLPAGFPETDGYF
jgi:hypothetical protein